MTLRDRSIREYFDLLGQRRTAPTGGAVAALCAVQASALVMMTARSASEPAGGSASVRSDPGSSVLAACEALVSESMYFMEKDTESVDALMLSLALSQDTGALEAVRIEAVRGRWPVPSDLRRASWGDHEPDGAHPGQCRVLQGGMGAAVRQSHYRRFVSSPRRNDRLGSIHAHAGRRLARRASLNGVRGGRRTAPLCGWADGSTGHHAHVRLPVGPHWFTDPHRT